ncbi:MAG: B12-binding domain-containing radical SAM protein [Actinobacteria bacterium]|nr:B12-binding domain-containing radical SAM protein [Actinomycetota bacterium]
MIRNDNIIEAEREAHQPPQPVHPLASKAKVLLSSVFGPYAQDDEYGSRTMNPMELYHNQVTRVQGPFSLRMFHRSWGLMLIQANIEAPCTLLDFPTLDRFVQEIRENCYDIVGISSIIPNIRKVRKMCELLRQYLPDATIVVGGHIANMPNLDARIDADIIVKGEGVRWFRRYLGEDEDQPIRHPMIVSGIGTRNMGITFKGRPGNVAATIIPSVGCPLGCNFCSTSAMFGGKGKFINFYETGDELFDVMCQLEETMRVQSFFIMDENFLLHRRRALRLLELMELHDKSWALYVFSSANVLRSYTFEQLVGLGISWVWMGLEGQDSQYTKLHGIDTRKLVGELQSHGIRVLGSSIIGLEEHTPENIEKVIDYAVQHDTDFHQFMLYTPSPGTPLHEELSDLGRMKDPGEYDEADIHGQLIFNYRHRHITNGQESEFIRRAFNRDFEVNGPSVARIVRTTLAGWKRYKNHPNLRIRRRYAWEVRELGTSFSVAIKAMRLYYRKNSTMRTKMSAILKDLHGEFGLKSRLSATIGGRYLLWKIRKEEERLATGWTYEPPMFYEKNHCFGDRTDSTLCRFVTPCVAPPTTPAAAGEQREPVVVG